MQLIGQLLTLNGNHRIILSAILGVFHCGFPQHHLRVVDKVLVEGKTIFGLSDLRPIRRNVQGTLSFLKKNDVRYNLSSCIGFESVVGQTDGSQQFGPLGQVPAHSGIFCIHGITACDKGYHTTRAHLIQRFGKKVVMDRESQLLVGFVVDLVLAEGHIADGEIVEIPPVGGLKPRYRDVGLGVKLLGDAAADGIQLHAVQFASGHVLRQQTKEIAHAAGWLQDVPRLKSHLSHSFINSPDHRGAGVMSIERGSSGCGIFLWCQQVLQDRVFFAPGFFPWVKGIRQAAPSHIPG